MTDRQEAVEEFAKWIYEQAASKADPDFDDLSPMERFGALEMANGIVGKVLQLVTPKSPDIQVVQFRLGILVGEVEAGPRYMKRKDVADLLRHVAVMDLADEVPDA